MWPLPVCLASLLGRGGDRDPVVPLPAPSPQQTCGPPHIIKVRQNILNNILTHGNLHHEFSHKHQMLLDKFLFKSYLLGLTDCRGLQGACLRSLCFQQGKLHLHYGVMRGTPQASDRAPVGLLGTGPACKRVGGRAS